MYAYVCVYICNVYMCIYRDNLKIFIYYTNLFYSRNRFKLIRDNSWIFDKDFRSRFEKSELITSISRWMDQEKSAGYHFAAPFRDNAQAT